MNFIDDEESDGNDDQDIIEHERKRKQAATRKTVPQGASKLQYYNEE